jgi:hypothetical protein
MILRRNLLLGILAAGAAPAIVRAQSLMPVVALRPLRLDDYGVWTPRPRGELVVPSMMLFHDGGLWWAETRTGRIMRTDPLGKVSVVVGPALP